MTILIDIITTPESVGGKREKTSKQIIVLKANQKEISEVVERRINSQGKYTNSYWIR